MTLGINLDELDRRLAVFDPHLPRHAVLDAIRALPEAEASVKLYRLVAIGSFALAMVSTVIAIIVLLIGSSHATELLTLRSQCITIESANLLAKQSEAIAAVNAFCINYHQEDRELMEAVLMRADKSYDKIYTKVRKNSTSFAIGEDAYEDVPVLPNAEATDFVLSGEDTRRWPGVLVQTVQQQDP